MKKKFSYVFIVVILAIFCFPTIVDANIVCNDGTISPSCTDCHRGCCSSHGGCSSNYSNSSSSSSKTTNKNSTTNKNNNSNSSASKNSNTTKQPIIKEESKSNDVSLKLVTVDNEKIDISNNMFYKTIKDNVNIFVISNDDKATIDYKSEPELIIGDNIIDIKVTAQNGNVKNYKLNIVREKALSNNKNIKVIVDNNRITFNAFKSQKIYLSNNKNEVDIEYELEDINAKATVIGNENLKEGNNEIIIRVTAENKEEQDYIINIEKYSKIEEVVNNIIFIVVIVWFFVGIGGLIYCLYRTSKNKKLNNQLLFYIIK